MIVSNFKPLGGLHCITNSLRQIFEFNSYPISEPMLFGLGSGLNFVYINLAESPMISGRIKIFELEQNISERLGIIIQIKSPKDNKHAYESLKSSIDNNIPVMLYVDMAYLKYLNLGEHAHFGGHSIVVFGYDESEKAFFVSDRDEKNRGIITPNGLLSEDFHMLSFIDMEKARASSFRPFPVKNKCLFFDFKNKVKIDRQILYEAIQINVNNMLNSPAKLLGINGIRKFGKEILKWKTFDKQKKKFAGITNYRMISSDYGTGGGAFRNMYGMFLLEAAEIFQSHELADSGTNFIRIARFWDAVALELLKLFDTADDSVIEKLSPMIFNIASREEEEFKRLRSLKIKK